MPVHRHRQDRMGSVYAIKGELSPQPTRWAGRRVDAETMIVIVTKWFACP